MLHFDFFLSMPFHQHILYIAHLDVIRSRSAFDNIWAGCICACYTGIRTLFAIFSDYLFIFFCRTFVNFYIFVDGDTFPSSTDCFYRLGLFSSGYLTSQKPSEQAGLIRLCDNYFPVISVLVDWMFHREYSVPFSTGETEGLNACS